MWHVNQFESGAGGYRSVSVHKSLAFTYCYVKLVYLLNIIYSFGGRGEPNTLFLALGSARSTFVTSSSKQNVFASLVLCIALAGLGDCPPKL